ncbi:MAG: outer membrane lipoprotein-sorting protein [Bdellovibrionales bacterium]|nr:outer membrane lipoprotein-sorting protein [Bdellovibrionales bacterium]
MKFFFLISGLLNWSQNIGALPSSSISPENLIKKVDEHRGLTTSHSVTVKIIVNDNGDKELSGYKVYVKDYQTSLVEQIEPKKNSDRKILMKGFDMWLFTATTKRPTRISLEQKLSGDVANGDIARAQYAKDYDIKILGEESLQNQKVWKLELNATNTKATYNKIHLWVNLKNYQPVEAVYFALSGKPLKKAKYLDFKKINGLERCTKMEIYDYVQKNKFSTLIYTNHKIEKFEDSKFNKDHMEF